MTTKKYFNNKFSSPSTEEEGDYDIDYDYQEIRSIDRSSAGSIPWAEDAIKQNQQEWECIENIFNDENAPLPKEDKELCREILEWKRFLKDHKINKEIKTYTNIQRKNTTTQEESEDDETLVENFNTSTLKLSKIPQRNLKTTSKIIGNTNYFIRNEKQSAKSVSFPIKNLNQQSVKILSKNFEKDLKLSSIPKRNNNIQRSSLTQSNKSIILSPTIQPQIYPIKIVNKHFPSPDSHQLFPSQSAKYLLEKYPNSIVTIERKISPHSANYTRIPPILNIFKTNNSKVIPQYNNNLNLAQYNHPLRNHYTSGGGVKTMRNNQIILPALNLRKHSLSNNNVGFGNLRSISAVHNHDHYETRKVGDIPELNRIVEYLPTLSASSKFN